MPFHFSLQPILKLRLSYERLERLRLLGLVAVMVRVREEMAVLAQESADARRRLQQTLGSGLAGVELQLEASCEKLRADRKQTLEARLANLSQKHEKQRLIYLNARQKREILENLRDRKWEEYSREQNRREQQRVDEMHLLHRAGVKLE
jgi:flagellar FliJ protein